MGNVSPNFTLEILKTTIMKALFTLLALLFCLTGLKAQNTVTIPDASFVAWLQTNIPAAIVGNQLDTTHIDVTTRTIISVQNHKIYNLDGVQYFDALTTLDCGNSVWGLNPNRIDSLPKLPQTLEFLICCNISLDTLHTLPSNLKTLVCYLNPLMVLPALPNTIEHLECWNDSLSSLPTLPTSLKFLNCSGNFLQNLPVLPTNLQSLLCNNNQLQNLPALPNSLDTINCSVNQLTSLPTLPTSLIGLDCSINMLTSLPTLPNSIVNLNCSQNPLNSLPILPSSIMTLFCTHNQLTVLPSLPNSLTHLICNNNLLTNLPTLNNGLYKLNCNENQLTSLPALPNTLVILYCRSNQLPILPSLSTSLTDLDCGNNFLPNLPSLPNSLINLACDHNTIPALPALPPSLSSLDCQVNQLTALPSLPNSLLSLNCSVNQITSLPVLPNNLLNLNCSTNTITTLPALPSSLYALTCSQNQITNLPTLPTALNVLDCSFNNIHCFSPFNTIPGYFNISHNPFTCLPNYIPTMDSIVLNYPLCAAGNPFNCPSSFGIVGFTYKDNTSNCLKDSGDVGLKNVGVKIHDTNGNFIGSTYTALNGVYQFLDTANTYAIVVDDTNLPYTASCVDPGLDSLVTVAALDTNINFALDCKPGYDVGVQSVSACGIVFPGQTHTLRINAGDISRRYNLNCASGISGVVSFKLTGPVIYLGPAVGSLTPNVSGNEFTYNIADFDSIDNANDFKILLQTFSTAQAGDPICVIVDVNPIGGDNNLSNNNYTTCYNVVNSHDPNIKEVYPIMVDPNYNDWLTYTIHFQNTGNAPAFNIMLADTLDNQLDLETFQVLDYSHDNSTSLVGRKLNVYFANIQLPDSSSNPEGSIGFIQYRIKPKATWVRPYQIKNTAYIYFDFNAPIVTNTTYNSIKDIVTEVKQLKESSVSLYPNPTAGIFTIELHEKEKQLVELFDIAGNTVLAQTIENGQGTVDASHLAAGVYTINIKGNSTVINKKVVIVK